MRVLINPEKSKVFATLFDIISNIIDELNIEFREDTLYIQTMDSSRISLFEMRLTKEWFDVYDVKKNTVIGIKLSIINKIINCRAPSQSIQFEFCESNMDKIDISLINGTTGCYDKFYKTSVYDFEVDKLCIPETDADSEFTINAITLFKLFDQLKQFGENIKITCTGDDITISTNEGDDFTGMKVKIPEEDIIEYTIDEDNDVEVEYNIIPICKAFSVARLSKASDISDNFTIHLSRDTPIVIVFNMFETSNIKFWIAPKILSDD